MTTIIADKQEVPIPDGFACIVRPQGMAIKIPSHTEINARTTVDYMMALDQRKWTHISTGPLFREFFNDVFGDIPGVKIPESVEDFPDVDLGVLHVSGLIITAFEAMCERGEKIFIRDPETHLHPAASRCLMTMIHKLRRLGGDQDAEGT